jgi:hypothetical protein
MLLRATTYEGRDSRFGRSVESKGSGLVRPGVGVPSAFTLR